MTWVQSIIEPQSTSVTRFIDLGCGGGEATKMLANRYGFNMVGIDVLDEALTWAETSTVSISDDTDDEDGIEIGSVSFSKGSAYTLPIADRSVDGSVTFLMPTYTKKYHDVHVLLSSSASL